MTYTPRAVIPLAARLFAKVDATGPCWLYTGARMPTGYATISRGRTGEGQQAVHRAVWELLVGPIPDGMDLDHLCRVRHCCNPDHLEPVDRQTNVDRGRRRSGLGRKTHCHRGHPITPCVPCRPCAAIRNREYRARQKVTA